MVENYQWYITTRYQGPGPTVYRIKYVRGFVVLFGCNQIIISCKFMWYIHSYSKRLFRCHWLRINVTEKFEQMWHGYAVYVVAVAIESIKTTSMENIRSTWKNNEHYLRSYDKAEKWYDVSSQNTQNMKIYYPLCQTYSPTVVDFQKVDQHAGSKWLIHDTKRHKGQSVAKPETPLQNIQVELLDVT